MCEKPWDALNAFQGGGFHIIQEPLGCRMGKAVGAGGSQSVGRQHGLMIPCNQIKG